MIFLIVGLTGAGKTTYARKIATQMSGVVYSIDNWMKDLYGQDMPADPTPDWFYENQQWYVDRIARCEQLIKKTTLERAKLKQASLLDLGFTTKKHRAQFIEYFKEHNIPVETHFIDVPQSIRKQRVEERNKSKGDTFVMSVDDSLFNYMESIFEAPAEDEGANLVLVKDN